MMSLWTLAFQIINFLILAAVLRRFLFRPVTRMIARRQEQIDRISSEVDAAKRDAEQSRVRYEHEREELTAERDRTLEEARAQMDQERGQVLEQARVEAASFVEAARTTIDEERRDAAAHLTDAAVHLAIDIATRLLAQAASGSITEAFLQRVCEHVDQMPAEQLRSLREELANGATSLVVATAPRLEARAEARWARTIAERLGNGGSVTFVVDDTLVAGAELRWPHSTLSFCWRDGLRAARERLVTDADNR